MIQCCDKEVTTLFCPYCGRIHRGPTDSLLAHVKLQDENFRNRLATRRKYSPGTKIEKRAEAISKKWASWRKALEDLIAFKRTKEQSNG